MSALDPSIVGQLVSDLPRQDLRLILQAFRGDLARLTSQLEAGAGAGDANAYQRAAHSLAGAASAVGATALEAAARLAMAPGALPQAGAVLPQVRTAAEAALAELAALAAMPE